MRSAAGLIGLAGIALWATLALAAEPLALSHVPDDQPTAKAYGILAEAYRRIGVATREELLPYERSLRAVNAGEVDGEVMRIAGIEMDYPNLARVPEPVYQFETMAYTTGLSFAVEGWESLRPYSLCVLRGVRLVERGTEGMNRTLANNLAQLVEMLQHGRCQVAVFGRLSQPALEALNGGSLNLLEPPVNVLPLFHYLHRRHQPLIPRLTEALRQMRQDGAMAAILAADPPPVPERR